MSRILFFCRFLYSWTMKFNLRYIDFVFAHGDSNLVHVVVVPDLLTMHDFSLSLFLIESCYFFETQREIKGCEEERVSVRYFAIFLLPMKEVIEEWVGLTDWLTRLRRLSHYWLPQSHGGGGGEKQPKRQTETNFVGLVRIILKFVQPFLSSRRKWVKFAPRPVYCSRLQTSFTKKSATSFFLTLFLQFPHISLISTWKRIFRRHLNERYFSNFSLREKERRRCRSPFPFEPPSIWRKWIRNWLFFENGCQTPESDRFITHAEGGFDPNDEGNGHHQRSDLANGAEMESVLLRFLRPVPPTRPSFIARCPFGTERLTPTGDWCFQV